jgi:hypothetical protein
MALIFPSTLVSSRYPSQPVAFHCYQETCRTWCGLKLMPSITKKSIPGKLVRLTRYGTGKEQGVKAYVMGDDFIILQFFKHEAITYLYERKSIGPRHLAMMKKLARAHDDLTTYINQNPKVRLGYTAKLDVVGSDHVRIPPRLRITATRAGDTAGRARS